MKNITNSGIFSSIQQTLVNNLSTLQQMIDTLLTNLICFKNLPIIIVKKKRNIIWKYLEED